MTKYLSSVSLVVVCTNASPSALCWRVFSLLSVDSVHSTRHRQRRLLPTGVATNPSPAHLLGAPIHADSTHFHGCDRVSASMNQPAEEPALKTAWSSHQAGYAPTKSGLHDHHITTPDQRQISFSLALEIPSSFEFHPPSFPEPFHSPTFRRRSPFSRPRCGGLLTTPIRTLSPNMDTRSVS